MARALACRSDRTAQGTATQPTTQPNTAHISKMKTIRVMVSARAVPLLVVGAGVGARLGAGDVVGTGDGLNVGAGDGADVVGAGDAVGAVDGQRISQLDSQYCRICSTPHDVDAHWVPTNAFRSSTLVPTHHPRS